MKINKDELKKLAELPDSQMWQGICAVAKSNGYNLTPKQPTHAELEKMREILRGNVKIGMLDAMRLIKTYKEGR